METEARARTGSGNGSDYGLLGFAGNLYQIGCASCVKDFRDGQLVNAE